MSSRWRVSNDEGVNTHRAIFVAEAAEGSKGLFSSRWWRFSPESPWCYTLYSYNWSHRWTFISWSDVFRVPVWETSVETQQKAVTAMPCIFNQVLNIPTWSSIMFRLWTRALNINCWRYHLGKFNWSIVIHSELNWWENTRLLFSWLRSFHVSVYQ